MLRVILISCFIKLRYKSLAVGVFQSNRTVRSSLKLVNDNDLAKGFFILLYGYEEGPSKTFNSNF
jgi:hypothetical protein